VTEPTALFVLGLGLIAACWWRLEAGSAREREVLLWVVAAAVPVAAVTLVVVFVNTDRGRSVHPAVLAVLALPVLAALVVGLLRPNLVDVRALLVGVVVAVVVVMTYVAAFVGAGAALDLLGVGSLTPATSALIGVVCAYGVHPLRVVLRGVIEQLLFGDRPDPLRAATRVAGSISDDPGLALDAVREALVLPYAALRAGGETLASSGTPVTHTESLPLRLGVDDVAELVVGLRAGDLRLGAADRQVLGVVVPLLAQTVRLRASREAAIAGIEDERRRLRRDLHDGLGATLTGVVYAADAARNLLGTDPAAADRQLAAVRSSAENAITEIRRLVDALRPPALDELGLAAALRQHAAGLPLSVEVSASDLPDLPAAVEVAAYRIGVEALTNVVRHARATSAALRLSASPDALTIEVVDDGTPTGPWTPGTGITSMHERAALVGGTLVAGEQRVTATLPVQTGLRLSNEADAAPSHYRASRE
jgi:two-component system, NarL family, sensor kinase